MRVEILSPEKQLYEGEAESVILPGADGKFGILNNHAPIIAALQAGEVKVSEAGGAQHTFTIGGGVVEVAKNKVVVLGD